MSQSLEPLEIISPNDNIHHPQFEARNSLPYSQICCEDVLFAIFDESLRKIEPIIVKFYSEEALVVNQLSCNLSHYEQLDFVRRVHMA